MTCESTVRSAKRLMLIGYLGIVIGGILFIVLTITSGQAMLGGAVAWGCGFSTAIYTASRHAISSLEKQLAFHVEMPKETEA